MGLYPRIKGPHLLTRAVRMKESRFLTVFVNCHPEDTAGKLMEYYSTLKPEKRLAESSRGLPRRDSPSEITSPSEKGAPFVCRKHCSFCSLIVSVIRAQCRDF
ncbi:mitochondrial transcription termination factor family protein [Musa troglodytarum]|uniref:Mitochondrial transcription termination factor family protein n=1 Tax=Musa troglodytarum TaxID=320322 RepID=A0A9E7E941_9LILI|nr:mitochondrial transcription termination factor family protein [Musa troglodytarum]